MGGKRPLPSKKQPVGSASTGNGNVVSDGWDSSGEEMLSQKKKAAPVTLLQFFGAGSAPAAAPVTAPTARAGNVEPTSGSDEEESEADDFNFDIPYQKAKPAPPPSSGNRISAPGMPPGWTVEVREAPSGRRYNWYTGPNGEKAQSVPDMMKKAAESAASFNFTAADNSDEGELDFAAPKKGTLEAVWRSKPRDEMAARAAAGKPVAKKVGTLAKVAHANSGTAASGKAAANQKKGSTSASAEGVRAGSDENDMLARLLHSKKEREEEKRLVTERIAEDVEQFMDNGVRINPELRKMFASDVGAS